MVPLFFSLSLVTFSLPAPSLPRYDERTLSWMLCGSFSISSLSLISLFLGYFQLRSPRRRRHSRLFRSVSFQAGLRAQLASIFDSNTLKQYPGPGVESRFNVLPRILSRVRKRLTTSRRGEFRPAEGVCEDTGQKKIGETRRRTKRSRGPSFFDPPSYSPLCPPF